MFLLKRVVSRIFFPVPLCLELLLGGVILIRFTRRKRLGKCCIGTGIFLLWLLSFQPFADTFYRPIQGKYKAFDATMVPESRPVAVCVLGQNFSELHDLPSTQRVSEEFKDRIWEGARVYRTLRKGGQKPELWISIGGTVPEEGKAELLQGVADLFQIDREDLFMIHEAQDTDDEIRLFKPHVRDKTMVLVSDRDHLPRALQIAAAAGLNPIPAPTTGISKVDGPWFVTAIPDAERLAKSEKAIYEYLGMAWVRLKSLF